MDEKLFILLLPIALLLIVLGWAVLLVRSGRDLDAQIRGLGVSIKFTTKESKQ